MIGVKRSPDSGALRTSENVGQHLPFLVRSLLRVSLEFKLLGANLIIVGLVLLVLFAPARLLPGPLTDIYVVIIALIVGIAHFFRKRA